MSIENMTIEQLKALAYDIIMDIQRLNNNLALVQAEIEKRKNAEQASVEKDGVK